MPHAEENQGFEAANILPPRSRANSCHNHRLTRSGSRSRSSLEQGVPFPRVPDRSAPEWSFSLKLTLVTVVNRPLDHQPPCIGVDRCIAICGSCQPNERARQLVLKLRHRRSCRRTPAFRYNRRSQPSAHTESKTFCDSLSFSSYFGSNHVLFIRSSRLPKDSLPTLHRGTQNPPAPRSTAYRGRCRPGNPRFRRIPNHKELHTYFIVLFPLFF